MSDINQWIASQPIEFIEEVGDVRKYINTSCTLEELEELDNRFINNGPEGGEVK